MAENELTLLTLNAGLAIARLFGMTVYTPSPFVDQRAAYLPSVLASLDPDVITLQEVYEGDHRTEVIRSLRNSHPYAASHDSDNVTLMDHGLLTFSKYPIKSSAFTPFTNRHLDESFVVKKGYFTTVLDTPQLGSVLLVNLHTTAGGLFRHPESRGVDAIRQQQIDQVLAVADASHADRIILAGDLNAGPNVSDGNYQSILAAGYNDSYEEVPGPNGPPECTWDPKNLLNCNGPHHACPPQRIDHVFVACGRLPCPHVRDARIVLRQPTVAVPGGHVTVSDHYGLHVRLAPTEA